ncbi:hypothetical protein C7S13_8443 [Burkholderia cepacia]|nr:hypothetical protein [Burkholderia cepacia]
MGVGHGDSSMIRPRGLREAAKRHTRRRRGMRAAPAFIRWRPD